MIFANVRNDLNRNDAQLAVYLVGRESEDAYAEAEATLRERGIDALLDDPRLLEGLLETRPAVNSSYHLFAYVIIRHALIALNLPDRMLADYVASVMMHFGIRGRAFKLSEVDDETYDTLTSVFAEIETSDPKRSFLARTHLGNYALWLSGVFPDHIAYRQVRKGGPNLDYYDAMGQKGFEMAAAHRLANEFGLVNLYDSVAEHFAMLRIALNNVSDSLLFPDRSSPDRLMRQVSNEFYWRNR